MLIESLDLSQHAARSRGFTYADRNHRIVFVHEDLSAEEKLLVLAHEEGHIFCGHMSSAPVIGRDVQEEYEANEFVHFILNRNGVQKVANSVRNRKKILVPILLCAALLIVGGIVFAVVRHEKQFSPYYITDTGSKYHTAECPYITDKTDVRRLTVEELESGDFEPCQVCDP